MSTDNALPDVIEVLRHRIEVLESLSNTPKDKRALVSELPIARSTLDRALEELDVLSLLTHSNERIELTLYGQLATKEYQRLEKHVDEVCHGADRIGDSTQEVIKTAVQRTGLMNSLGAEPREKPALVEDLNISRSTVDRAMWELENVGLIEYASGDFRLTEIGQVINSRYATFEEHIEGLLAASELLRPFDTSTAIDPAVLVDAEVVFPGKIAPFSTGEYLLKLLRGATRLRILSKGHVLPDSPGVLREEVLENGMACEAVIQSDMFEYLQSEFPHGIARIGVREDCMLATIDSLPFGLWVLKRADSTHVCIEVFDHERRFDGLIINDTEDAIEWGKQTYDRYLQRADQTDH